MKPLLIFGAGEFADVAHYYFTRDAGRQVAAFVVDDQYLREDHVGAVPVLAWSEARTHNPPDDHDIFVAIGYSQLNRARVNKAAEIADAGYSLAAFLHSRTVVWDGFELKENCFILEHNTLQPFCHVGANAVLWSGNHVGHHATIEHGCFITSHVVIAGGARIGEASFVGINVAIRDHITVGKRNVIGAGTYVSADTPDDAVVPPPATPVSPVPSNRLRRI